MISASATANEFGERRLYTSIALMMLGVVGGTCLLLLALAHNEPFLDWVRDTSWEENRSKKQIPLYCFTHHFVDADEYLFHQDIPSLDSSRGGVYYVGASCMRWALHTWDLPAETRPLIHNLAMAGTKHSDQFDLIRFLVEQEGILKAGGEKTLVVFGLSYRFVHHGRLPGDGPSQLFEKLWTRHGFYTIDHDGTALRTGLNPLAKKLILERSRITGLLKELVNLIYVPFKSVRVHNHAQYDNDWSIAMGPDWKELMDSELNYFKKTIEYLQQRKVKIAVTLLPMGSWGGDLPYHPAYVKRLREICDSAGLKLHDFTRALPDDDFADSDHFTPDGIEKFRPTLLEFAYDHLRSIGLLPPSHTAKKP